MMATALACLSWFNSWSGLFTAVLGGGFAMTSACLLFMIATALGPDVPVFQCVSTGARGFAKLTAFTWFVRGALVLTTTSGPDARHPHWDMPVSWGMTTALLCYLLAYLWRQRMLPEVRERFDRRNRARELRVHELIQAGLVSEAKLAASGHDVVGQLYDMGMPPEAIARVRSAP